MVYLDTLMECCPFNENDINYSQYFIVYDHIAIWIESSNMAKIISKMGKHAYILTVCLLILPISSQS